LDVRGKVSNGTHVDGHLRVGGVTGSDDPLFSAQLRVGSELNDVGTKTRWTLTPAKIGVYSTDHSASFGVEQQLGPLALSVDVVPAGYHTRLNTQVTEHVAAGDTFKSRDQFLDTAARSAGALASGGVVAGDLKLGVVRVSGFCEAYALHHGDFPDKETGSLVRYGGEVELAISDTLVAGAGIQASQVRGQYRTSGATVHSADDSKWVVATAPGVLAVRETNVETNFTLGLRF
jgi:hypothetical protein